MGEIERTAERLPDHPDKTDPGLSLPLLEIPANVCVYVRTWLAGSVSKTSRNLCHYVLMINVRGAALMTIDGIPVPFKPGEALLIFPHQAHSCACLSPDTQKCLVIAFQLPKGLMPANLKFIPFRLTSPLRNHIKIITKIYSDKRRYTPYLSALISFHLWLLLLGLRAGSNSLPAERRASTPSDPEGYSRVFQKAFQYIMAHLAEPIYINDVARHVNLSPAKLALIFKKYCGQTVGRFVRDRRFTQAVKLINSSDASFKEIAYQCGFGSLYAFSLAVKKETGCSPSRYKELINKRGLAPGIKMR